MLEEFASNPGIPAEYFYGLLAQYAAMRLRKMGVHLLLGQRIVAVQPNYLLCAGEASLPYDTLIWAGGIRPPAVLRATGLPLNSYGYPEVDGHGRVQERVWVAGDLWVVRQGGRLMPQTAQVAIQGGAHVAQALLATLAGMPLGAPFVPHLRGVLVSLDAHRGVGWVTQAGIPVRGYAAGLLKTLTFADYRLKLAKGFRRPWPWEPVDSPGGRARPGSPG